RSEPPGLRPGAGHATARLPAERRSALNLSDPADQPAGHYGPVADDPASLENTRRSAAAFASTGRITHCHRRPFTAVHLLGSHRRARVDVDVLAGQTRRAQCLFAWRLRGRALEKNHQVPLLTDSEEHAQKLDEVIWTSRPDAFIPHASL